jgi:hypothetical protein
MPIRHAPIRARDLRANIKEYGYEQGIVTTLEMFFDEFAEVRQHQREMVELLSQCVDQVAKMVQFGDALKDKMEQMQRDRSNKDDTD